MPLDLLAIHVRARRVRKRRGPFAMQASRDDRQTGQLPEGSRTPPVAIANIDAFLAQALAAPESTASPAFDLDVAADSVWQRIEFHGIALALCDADAGLRSWPEDLRESVLEEARHQVLWEESHREVVIALLDRLDEQGIPALVMKGTALAYSVYDRPATRRRGDTDLLVARSDLRKARQVMAAAGLERISDAHFGQEVWVRDTGIGFVHAIDLHWEVIGSPSLRRLIGHDECFAHAIPLERLAGHARTLDPVLQLLRGAINRELHIVHGYIAGAQRHHEGDRLIWRMDTHLLAPSLTEGQWRELGRLACERGLAGAILTSLRGAQASFGTTLCESAVADLEAAQGANPIADHLAETNALARLRADLAALETPEEKLELFRVRVFPSRSQIERRYPEASGWPMPLQHLYRLLSAGLRLFTGRRGR
ncbi:nucleotidyltransferase family protein [Alteraurantiacibacter aquimixticola]|uniref:Nucleotidyltransferase family protein n=1 Tax=Alteraurantiacibacter aquimixticola TaxID=2489173 RepID=A0A4T3EYM5_9SPHN|nr:nucleotidyltransferase family protein [Alteraurantiacibacter aquimixticola]TIX48969.1 hypothetical protein E5222_14635 [Alteraurantiacibacter aquimixticola]